MFVYTVIVLSYSICIRSFKRNLNFYYDYIGCDLGEKSLKMNNRKTYLKLILILQLMFEKIVSVQ